MNNLTNNTTELQEVINLLQDKIASGMDTSDATAAADEIFAGETAYNAEGKVTGTFTIDEELTTQNDLLSRIATALRNKARSAGQEILLQSKTVTPTKDTQNVAADAEYDGLEMVTVNPIPDEYIIPSGTRNITLNGTYDINNYKNIEVNVPIPEGYIIPSGNLDIIENGTYEVTDKASVTVEVAGGGGGTDTTIKDFVEGNQLEINDETVTKIRTRAFNYATNLTAVNFPNAVSVSSYAFAECTGLVSANLPNVTTATTTFLFDGCTSLKNVNIPKVTAVSNYAFRDCEALEKIELGNISSCGSYSFSNATSLVTVIIRREGAKATTLNAINAFNGTPIASGTGYVYVPRALVDTFKAASNWVTYAAQIRAIEDYPEICG